MDEPITTPSADPQGTPPAAGPQAGDHGSETPNGGIDLVTVPHPDFDEPGDGEPQAPQPPAGQDQTGADTGNAPAGDQPTHYKTLTYRGQEYPIASEDQLKELASMGLDYAAKTQIAAPYVQFAKRMNALERTNPEQAEAVKAMLEGREPAQPGKAGAAPEQPIYMQTEDGSLVPVPQEFMSILDQYLERKGLTGKPDAGGQPNQELTELRQAVAPMVLQQRVDQCAAFVKQTYGRDDFQQAIPMIQQELARQGIVEGDPRDNPQTWVGVYAQLALGGRLDGINPQTKVKDQPANQSGLKRGALPPHGSPTPKPPEGWKSATEKALKSGAARDFEQAIAERISHPELEE